MGSVPDASERAWRLRLSEKNSVDVTGKSDLVM